MLRFIINKESNSYKIKELLPKPIATILFKEDYSLIWPETFKTELEAITYLDNAYKDTDFTVDLVTREN